MSSLPPANFTPLTDTVEYETGIYQIGTSDLVMGGDGGLSNYQGQGLANRTAWLKAQLAGEMAVSVRALRLARQIGRCRSSPAVGRLSAWSK